MEKKKWRCVLVAILMVWAAMFFTDYYMSTHLRKAVFVVPVETADDGGSGLYQGLGYQVNIQLDGNVPDETVLSTTMSVFGNVVGASTQ